MTIERNILRILDDVKDPEIPVLSIAEMGILRGVDVEGDQILVRITPTYSGCPAMHAIRDEIRETLNKHGYSNVEIREDFSEAWTTDWFTDEAREKLNTYGIAPPQRLEKSIKSLEERTIPCPFCGSENTHLTSEFGSTSCKALFYCKDCEQPFEHFKCH